MIAYIDPSVATYAVQALAGIAVAGGAVLSVKLRKARKKAAEKLNIHTDAKKEVEDEVKEF